MNDKIRPGEDDPRFYSPGNTKIAMPSVVYPKGKNRKRKRWTSWILPKKVRKVRRAQRTK